MTEEQTDKFIKIAGVRFRENWKVYDFDATEIELAVGDQVIVDSERGHGFASVVRIRKAVAPLLTEKTPVPPVPALKPEISEGIEIEIEAGPKEETTANQTAQKSQGPKATRKILRKATEEDMAREKRNRQREAEAYSIAQDMISERELPMKLIRVEYTFDASRATFYFFSENRIDFRELVKDLAYKLKSRIEMRQIGVRDVARMIGGFGPCGRELCCSSFLRNFEPVSIRMAKKQEMVLNPAKISGVCGRLLCCLSYEYEMYDANKKDLEDMRQSAVKEKKEEEERLIVEERKLAEAQRIAEEKKRQDERSRHQDERGDKQREGGQKAGVKHDRKKEQHEKKAQTSQPEKQKQRHQQQQPRSDRQQPQDQVALQQQQEQKTQQQPDGQKPGKRRRRRFWRRKKKGGQQQAGDAKQAPPPNPQPGL